MINKSYAKTFDKLVEYILSDQLVNIKLTGRVGVCESEFKYGSSK